MTARAAYLLLRDEPHYRADAFAAGLQAAGCRVMRGGTDQAGPGDVVVTWNCYGDSANQARRARARGAVHLVAENGYLGTDRPGDRDGRQLYALARDAHNGAGWWPHKAGDGEGDAPGDRWAALGIDLQPWRAPAAKPLALVCPQRGIGSPPAQMPDGWGSEVKRALVQAGIMARLRPHPGRHAPTVPLAADLKDASCVVVWGSKAGIEAIVAGVPVFHAMPGWIGAGAAVQGLPRLPLRPFLGERLPMLRRLAWAQWTLAELAGGLPFRLLLGEA